MPTYLPVPNYDPRGPDGQGWNRLSIGSLAGDECALKPTDYPTLYEARDTRRARYGKFGRCSRKGACRTCPVLTAKLSTLRSFTERVLVRIDDQGRPWVMNKPEDGWSSRGELWTWAKLARLAGWRLGRRQRDEHGDGFWLHAARSENGIFGEGEPLPAGKGKAL